MIGSRDTQGNENPLTMSNSGFGPRLFPGLADDVRQDLQQIGPPDYLVLDAGVREEQVDERARRAYPRPGRRSLSPASPLGLRSHACTLASISSSEASGFSRRICCRYIRTPASHMSKGAARLEGLADLES
jgi:hypothetical protein